MHAETSRILAYASRSARRGVRKPIKPERGSTQLGGFATVSTPERRLSRARHRRTAWTTAPVCLSLVTR